MLEGRELLYNLNKNGREMYKEIENWKYVPSQRS